MKQNLVIGCFVLFVACQTNTKNPEKEPLPSEDVYMQMVNEQIKTYTQENLYKQIENQNVYLGKNSSRTMPLKKLVSTHKFFFYFSAQTCPPCILQTVDCIKSVFPHYEEDQEIFFISPDYPARLKENCHGKRLLTLQKSGLEIPLESVYVPFLFTLDEDLRINTLHIVNKNDFSKTMEYLERIKEIRQ